MPALGSAGGAQIGENICAAKEIRSPAGVADQQARRWLASCSSRALSCRRVNAVERTILQWIGVLEPSIIANGKTAPESPQKVALHSPLARASIEPREANVIKAHLRNGGRFSASEAFGDSRRQRAWSAGCAGPASAARAPLELGHGAQCPGGSAAYPASRSPPGRRRSPLEALAEYPRVWASGIGGLSPPAQLFPLSCPDSWRFKL